ncbi:stage II sporulation protein M [Paenibacillus caui]|uniref:stage II sporulation protein M n=1 Tax=Paenibacillus caui TaxID=2873927 RepID=UPI001CA99256|nr:stage II sporulation protein M [Paenibacillus caui]
MLKLHLVRYKWSMVVSVVLFAVGVMLGTINAEALQHLIAGEVDKLRQVSENLSSSDHPELSFFVFIFLNNAIKSVLVIWSGVMFGILPILFLLLNGMALGFVVETNAQSGGDIGELIVKGLLPHGIIEIPALLIACAYGLQFGVLVWRSIVRMGDRRKKQSLEVEWKTFVRAAVGATFWVVILLGVAAIIESTLTFYLVQN